MKMETLTFDSSFISLLIFNGNLKWKIIFHLKRGQKTEIRLLSLHARKTFQLVHFAESYQAAWILNR